MASLDVDLMLKAISEEAPCGANLEYDPAFTAMEDESKGTPERQVGENIEPGQPPNWKSLRKMVLELMERTRDLRLLVELARADLNLEGLVGFKNSLSLLRKCLEEYWDSIHPQLDPEDDNDPTNRINVLMGLCDRDTMLLPLLGAPLVESRMVGRFSLRDIQYATGKVAVPSGQTAPQLALIEGAFTDVPVESVKATQDLLRESLSDVNGIENFITQQVGVGNAPSFTPLRDLLKDALHFVDDRIGHLASGSEVGGEEAEDIIETPRSNGGSGEKKTGPMGGIKGRQDVIKAFDLICEYYAGNEPSSPVPLLVRRAKSLVTMDFMEIIQNLVPSGVSEAEIFKGPDAQ